MNEQTDDLREAIWERVFPEPMSGCWLWTGADTGQGYGRLNKRAAHRISWEAHNGRPVPQGMWVLHKCDNPPCVNPDHLYVGTHADNMRDALARDRFHRWGGARAGAKNPKAKLTADNVREIRSLVAQKVRREDIAAKFGVTRAAIYHILYEGGWKDVA